MIQEFSYLPVFTVHHSLYVCTVCAALKSKDHTYKLFLKMLRLQKWSQLFLVS